VNLSASARTAEKPSAAALQVAAWADDYEPLPGIPDEFIGADGERRPHWVRLLEALAELGGAEIAHRFATADKRVRSRGMSYRVKGETAERVWPLGRMPLLIPEAEWREIAEAVEQRAELLEQVLADIYGEGRLIAEGALPAAAIAGSADFLPAMRGVKPPGGR
jgi:uncharacterized circularly permuted ATP-grasp superfamily protein